MICGDFSVITKGLQEAWDAHLSGHCLPNCVACGAIDDVFKSGTRVYEYLKIFNGDKMTDPKVGIGGAPTRATVLPDEPSERKKYPIATGFMDYFPDAIAVVSHVSFNGNEQHNPGQPLHWARGKSQDEADTMMRHFSQRGTRDVDGQRHTAKMAWRALAILQKEIEDEKTDTVQR